MEPGRSYFTGFNVFDIGLAAIEFFQKRRVKKLVAVHRHSQGIVIIN
jgi:hypothetical protein